MKKEGVIHQTHQIGIKAETLKALCWFMHSYHQHQKHWLTGMSKIRYYTFFAILSDLGRQPFIVFSTIAMLLYGEKHARLIKVYKLPIDTGTANRWRRECQKEVDKALSNGLSWRQKWQGWRHMEKAKPEEARHIQFVLHELSNDIFVPASSPVSSCSLYKSNFRDAYEETFCGKREEEKDNNQEIERDDQKGDCLKVCDSCGNISRLSGEEAAEMVRLYRWSLRSGQEIGNESERLIACIHCGKRSRLFEEITVRAIPLHRGDQEFERKGEHLIVCTQCGGVPSLFEEARVRPPPELYVPGHFH